MASLSTCHLGLWLGWQILLNLVKVAYSLMEASLSVFTIVYLGAIRMDNNVTGKLSWCQFAHVTELTIRRTKHIMAETVYYIDFL